MGDDPKFQLQTLQTVHKALERELKLTQEDLDVVTKERDNFRRKATEATAKLEETQEELQVTQDDYRELHEQLQGEEEESDRLTKEAELLNAELESERNKRLAAEHDLEAAQKEVKRVSKVLNKWERDMMIKAIEGGSEGGAASPVSESEAVGQLKELLDNKSEALEETQFDLKTTQEKLAKLEKQLKEVESNPFRHIGASKGGDDEPSSDAGVEADAVRQAMQGQISKLGEQLQTLRDDKKRMESELDEAHEFGEEVHKRLQKAVEMLKASREENAKLTAQLAK